MGLWSRLGQDALRGCLDHGHSFRPELQADVYHADKKKKNHNQIIDGAEDSTQGVGGDGEWRRQERDGPKGADHQSETEDHHKSTHGEDPSQSEVQ